MYARRIFGIAIFGLAIPVIWATTLCAQETEAVERPSKAAASEKKAAKPREMDHFMRIGHDRRGRAVSLETSITRYETVNANNEVVTVDLIGVVHVGDDGTALPRPSRGNCQHPSHSRPLPLRSHA